MDDIAMTVKMRALGGVDDFLVIYKRECSDVYNGYYVRENKVAVVFILDEWESEVPDYVKEKVAIHELTHHLLTYYKEWESTGDAHDKAFKVLFNELLEKYYRGAIPVKVLELLKEEERYEQEKRHIK